MPAPLSVVIPTLNAAEHLPATADALLEGVSSGLISEVVIADGGSTDGIEFLSKELGAKFVECPPGRGTQMRIGAAATKSDWILFLHADTQLEAGWAKVVFDHMNINPDRAAWFRLRFASVGWAPRMTELGANWRSRTFGLPYGDQGLVISRKLLDEIGGVPDLPLMEDVVLAKRLKGRLSELKPFAITSSEKYEKHGWLNQSSRNIFRLLRFKLGTDPTQLAANYGSGSAEATSAQSSSN